MHSHSPDEQCPSCWASTRTPLFCESCEALIKPEKEHSPFELLGIEPEFDLDRLRLRKHLLALSRKMHPDFFVTSDEDTRALAQRNTAELNAAFEILADDFRRADWLVTSLGGPAESEERQMPQEFLMDVLEWNEAVDEARSSEPGSPARLALEELQSTLEEQREQLMASVAAELSPLPELRSDKLTGVRQRLNAVRYLDRTLHEIAELRLAQAATTD
jgi:molecular chaperone HscB